MNIEILPELLKIYKNYYNNQLYTYTKNLKSTSVANIIPSTISILKYFQKFDTVYLKENPDEHFIKATALNGLTGIDAMSFYSNIKNWLLPNNLGINYNYFYLNTTYPSAVSLTNIWLQTPDAYKEYEYVSIFIDEFNNYFSSSSGSSINWNITTKTYPKYGLFPAGGTKTYIPDLYPNNQNIGYLNFYYHPTVDIIEPQYIIYLMLESHSPYNYLTENNGYGVALIIYTNYNN